MLNLKRKSIFKSSAAVIMAALMLLACGTEAAAGNEPEHDCIYAAYPGDVLPLYNGEFLDIDEGALFAAVTGDRSYLVTWYTDGRLAVSDLVNDRKALLSKDCASLVDIRDSGLLYTDTEDNSYRVLFANASRLKLGKTLEMRLAENSMSLIYADAYDNILSLAEDESEPKVLGVCDSYVCLDGISDNGDIAVWTEIRGNKSSIFISDGGNKTQLAEIDTKYCGTWLQLSADEKLAIVASNYSDRMWIKQAGRTVKNVYLDGEAWYDSFYCDTGSIGYQNAGDIEYVYVSAGAELYNDVLRVRMNGNAKPVLSEALVYGIAGGRILYENENGLYSAKLKEGKLSGEKKLSEDAALARISPDGMYAFYFECLEDNIGRLVCCNLKNGKSFVVAEDAVGLTNDYYATSPDGETLFFYRNARRAVEIGLEEYAELWVWSRGDKEPVLIDSDVIIGSLSSGLKNGIDKENFSYVKYLDTDTEGNITGSLMYYDGEAELIDEKIIYG